MEGQGTFTWVELQRMAAGVDETTQIWLFLGFFLAMKWQQDVGQLRLEARGVLHVREDVAGEVELLLGGLRQGAGASRIRSKLAM